MRPPTRATSTSSSRSAADGTVLGGARMAAAAPNDPPVLGLACGSLGALAAVRAGDTERALARHAAGDWAPLELDGLRVTDEHGATAVALNDVCVVRKGAGQVKAAVHIDDELYVRCAGDGVIVSTALGSSAYGMAAGGPVLAPGTQALSVTPLAMHGGSAPPLVVPSSSRLRIEVAVGFAGRRLEVDGQPETSAATRWSSRWSPATCSSSRSRTGRASWPGCAAARSSPTARGCSPTMRGWPAADGVAPRSPGSERYARVHAPSHAPGCRRRVAPRRAGRPRGRGRRGRAARHGGRGRRGLRAARRPRGHAPARRHEPGRGHPHARARRRRPHPRPPARARGDPAHRRELRARPGERFLGFGERSDAVVRDEGEVQHRVTEGPYQPVEDPFLAAFVPAPGYNTRTDATYFPVPWLISTRGYGVLVEDDPTSFHRLGSPWSVDIEGDTLTLLVVAGPTPSDVLRRFTAHVGRQPAVGPRRSGRGGRSATAAR
jgi:hypothetical protein